MNRHGGGRRRGWWLASIAACAALSSGCSSALGDLEGDWDVSFTGGIDLVTGEFSARDASLKLTVIGEAEGQVVGVDCRRDRFRYEIVLSIDEDDDSRASGSVTEVNRFTGAGCTDAGETRQALAVLEGFRRSEESSDFGDLGGDWDIRVAGDDCTVSLRDATFSGSCASSDYQFEGSLDEDRLTGRGKDDLEFVAQRR